MSADQTAPLSAAGDERYRDTRRVTIVGALVNLVLAVIKLVAGVVGHSQALIADGVHSLSDLASDGMVLLAARHASRDADEDHPYGHGRFETLATVGLGLALLGVAAGLAYDAGTRLFEPERLMRPTVLALAAAVVSILAKEGLYHYTLAAARRQRSNLLRGNAWHHRSDAISSVIVVIGVGGTMAGLPYLDALGAIGVAVMIAKISWDLAWHSLRELVDTALEQEHVAAIRRAIHEVDGVEDLHLLRTRRMGPDALVDVHVLVDPKLSVSEGHKIGDAVRGHLLRRFEEVADVTVHVDPEDDEEARPSDHLPMREEMVRRLRRQWAGLPASQAVRNVILHYLDGRVHVEIHLPLTAVNDVAQARHLSSRYTEVARALPEVGVVRVLYE